MIIFGPVPSRRLGRSLGIDIIPLKCCSFDCVYCEVGKTTCHTFQRYPYVSYDEVINELKQFIKKNIPYDTLTFSGSGEPTLNSDIGKMIDWMRKNTNAQIAVLTNGSLLDIKEVRDDIKHANIILPSLDAISTDIVNKLNKPAKAIDMDKIVEGLHILKREMTGKMWLEVLLVKGYNDTKEEWYKLKKAIDYINPDFVDINTVVRPSRTVLVHPVSAEQLKSFAELIGNKARVIAPFSASETEYTEEDVKERLIKTLEIRPCSLDELSVSLGIDEKKVKMILKEYIIKEEVKTEMLDGKEFFYINRGEYK